MKITREVSEHQDKLLQALEDIATDLTNLKSAIDAIATKLNSDGGVTDTNYAAAPALNTSND